MVRPVCLTNLFSADRQKWRLHLIYNSSGEMKFATWSRSKSLFYWFTEAGDLLALPHQRGEILRRQTFLIIANGHCYGLKVLEAQRLVCPSRAHSHNITGTVWIFSRQHYEPSGRRLQIIITLLLCQHDNCCLDASACSPCLCVFYLLNVTFSLSRLKIYRHPEWMNGDIFGKTPPNRCVWSKSVILMDGWLGELLYTNTNNWAAQIILWACD